MSEDAMNALLAWYISQISYTDCVITISTDTSTGERGE